MSTSIPLPTKPESNQDALYEKIIVEYEHLIKTLPEGKGWLFEHICNYNGFWLGPIMLKNVLLLQSYFKSQPSDVFLASFVKSGTTWLKALMFSTINRHRYTISDHHLLHHAPQTTFPNIEVSFDHTTDLTHLPAPRLFHTHLPRTLLPPSMTSCKFVYICRDPKDVLISKWYFMNKIKSKDLAPLSMDEAFELFCQGVSEYGPLWDQALQYWRASLDSPNKVLFLKYEELKKQPEVELRKLAAFIGHPFTVEEEEKGVVEGIVKLCSFENLSNLEVNKAGSNDYKVAEVDNSLFFRKGEIGDWKNYLSEEMKERIDRITNEKLKGSGLILGCWRRALRGGREENEKKNLERICENLPVNEVGRGWTWGLTSNGIFTVASLREALDDMTLRRCGLPTIWINTVPIKVRICYWRARLGRLPTKINLVKRRMGIESDLCVMCNDERETGNHIFFTCRKATEVRRALNLWMNLFPNSCANWEDFYNVHGAGSNFADDKKILEITRQAYIWAIWIGRNNVIFNNKVFNSLYTAILIQSLVHLWTLARG
ncbi:hypothetical protein OSB04_005428 [Centaurea solstitialis]|uniref:Sulfotransferase n=1 Tax=Centaurea solstitialis TaxID=347529 RepID=A0AA38TNM7_9ASTR|nr:hypothetical protein OSB04_005428 [Centaurea solstitialis]